MGVAPEIDPEIVRLLLELKCPVSRRREWNKGIIVVIKIADVEADIDVYAHEHALYLLF